MDHPIQMRKFSRYDQRTTKPGKDLLKRTDHEIVEWVFRDQLLQNLPEAYATMKDIIETLPERGPEATFLGREPEATFLGKEPEATFLGRELKPPFWAKNLKPPFWEENMKLPSWAENLNCRKPPLRAENEKYHRPPRQRRMKIQKICYLNKQMKT